MKSLNKLTSLQLVRNMAHIEYNKMLQKWIDKKIDTQTLANFMNEEVYCKAEDNLSIYLNKN
jgi:hypothetical protein